MTDLKELFDESVREAEERIQRTRRSARPVPELPEGYREEENEEFVLLQFNEGHDYWFTVATWCERHNYMSFPGNGLDLEHAQALAIWLQRRSK